MLERKLEEKLLIDSGTEKSFAEKYALRVQVKMSVEEIMMREAMNVFH